MSSGDFFIEQNNATGRMSYWDAGENQSVADRDGVSLADYIHAMFGFIRQAGCRRVLMIGCGGGTMATMLHRVGVETTVVDIDPRAFEIARAYFHMPPDIACHVADGRAFLRRNAGRFDAIALDAYDGAAIPRQFVTPAFFRLARARLRRGGIFLMNVIVADDDDRTPDRIARTMQAAWRDVRLLDCDGWIDRNAVVLGGAVKVLRRPRLLMPPARSARSIANELRTFHFRALRD